MDVNQVILAVKRQFGDETGAQITDADIIRWINDGQLIIYRKMEGAITNLGGITVAGAESIALPSNFLKLDALYLDGKKIQFIAYSQLKALYPTLAIDATGLTKFCSIKTVVGTPSALILAPKPANQVIHEIRYGARPIAVIAGDQLSLDPAYHETLVTYCISRAKQLDGDDAAFQMMDTMFERSATEDMHDAKHMDEETYPFIRVSGGDY